ncbi:arginase-2, mitochondrial isoform X3 [Enoplosus armatus]|uniref:arginase-2, mitochondrial isoform X3 n=1 Tax=Enoplosus armatus TaxID=215367 RepID=UPI00399136AE
MALKGPLFRLLRAQLSHTCQQSRAQSVAVLGAPFSRGQKRRGVEHGPKVIRDAGLIERLSGLDYSVHDFGDLNFHHLEKDEPYMNVKSPRTVGGANKIIAGAVSRAVGAGHTLVMLGGDHSHILKTLGIQYFTMRDIDRLGIQRVMEVTLDHLLARKQRPIHLSYDIDAFDPSLAPATGTPVNGGLTYREGIYITEEIHNTGLLSAMDLVEVNPVLGANREAVEATASLAVNVIASSLGQTREGAHVSIDEIPPVKDDTEQLRL